MCEKGCVRRHGEKCVGDRGVLMGDICGPSA